ncbi:MAG: DUF1801 domain-containing protein [Actinomycetota bacterium]|nr:DUF1801 domain-containing protein [Actinomycetota bacterium]
MTAGESSTTEKSAPGPAPRRKPAARKTPPNKTQPGPASVGDFIAALPDGRRRADALALLELMTRATGAPAVIWGSSIVGFGTNHYVYASGREGDQPAVAFSPRKANLALYGLLYTETARRRLADLGRYKTGVGCLYIASLAEVDLAVLEGLIRHAFAHMQTARP